MDYIRNDYETILARKDAKEEGSYTCYLFEQGIDKILKKSARNRPKWLSPQKRS